MASENAVLDIGWRERGYVESPPGSNGNKFGVWYGMNNVPWCAIFVSYCFAMAGMPLQISTKRGFAYCPYGVDAFKKLGRWHTSNPQRGDVVFFDWDDDGKADHVGIVLDVNDPRGIHTLEGNTAFGPGGSQSNGGCVTDRFRSPKDIQGYGRPVYDGVVPASAPQPSSPQRALPPFRGRMLTLASPLMSGPDVLQWQDQMRFRGWKLDVDGVYGPGSAEVCRQFQVQKGLPADGVVGPLTWATAWTAPVT